MNTWDRIFDSVRVTTVSELNCTMALSVITADFFWCNSTLFEIRDPTMDFSKFRESSDLSDIKVIVETQEHKLHKFPLYARSDYFCELARSKSEGELDSTVVELKVFPGGNEIFEQVADFCYNMPINITKNNIVATRCAAQYLRMFGPGNLADISDKYLADTISSAKLARSTASVMALLMQCNNIGETASAAGIVDICTDAFVECWVKPQPKLNPTGSRSVFAKAVARGQNSDVTSAFTRVQGSSSKQTTEKLDEVTVNSLISLCADWFVIILTKAREKGVSWSELGSLAVRYITSILDNENGGNAEQPNKEIEPGLEGHKAASPSADDEKDKDTGVATLAIEGPTASAEDTTSLASVKETPKNIDVGYVLDKVVLALPEEALTIPSVTMEWLTKVLRVATGLKCTCRTHLVRVAGEMLTRLGPEDLCIISPSVLHDIVVDAHVESGKPSSQLHNERACKLVDTYMGQMTSKGILTTETFRLLATATKNYSRATHDGLYNALEFVLKSEKSKLTPEQCTELMDLVNFDLLTECSLQRALDEEVAPESTIARSALKLCSRLRSELASVKYIAEMQEEDIQKYQNAAAASSSLRSHASPVPISGQRHFSSYLSRDRNIDSGYSEATESNRDKTPEPLKPEDLEHSDHQQTTDPLKAAQSVLTAARHKLALPIYTGYRPTHLSRMSPPSSGGHAHSFHGNRGAVEHDISLEDELEFKSDRTFRSLDPRVRHQRLSYQHGHYNGSGQRTYFPYSNYSHRF